MGRAYWLARAERTAAGEGLLREAPLPPSIPARADAHPHVTGRLLLVSRAGVMRPLAGLTEGAEGRTRRARRTVEVGEPAPLLMRLMRFKTTVALGVRKKQRLREPLEGRDAVSGPAAVVAGAWSDHARPAHPRPVVARPVGTPRGLAAGAPAAVRGDGEAG